ncbi:MAG: HAMP domain-containing protein [Desertifilum sp.]|nr:HAMP domain-containing protein [Desertifilum sp.]
MSTPRLKRYPFRFRSIRTRIMSATTLLIVAIVGSLVWTWIAAEREVFNQQAREEAEMLAVVMADAWVNELFTQNWSQIRVGINVMMQRDRDFVYILVSDVRVGNQIIAASPEELQGRYIPDVVNLAVTQEALSVFNRSIATETYLLRDVEYPQGTLRAMRGEPLIEGVADIRNSANQKIGTVRVGISLSRLHQARLRALMKALMVGFASLGVGLVGAYVLAQRMSQPVKRLQVSAQKIAAGDLQHRALVNCEDEIGRLADSFNQMSASLQASFTKLEGTLHAFERFVPNKFLSAIASNGVENIQVGTSSTRTITILFCDIRGYTSMSEQLTPQETFNFLNDYLACMGQAIEQAGGFIDKYIGDAIMALFDSESADCALDAALGMRKALKQFNQDRLQRSLPRVEIGIGIHRGEVVMGTVGYTSRIDSTVIGDAVNLASRIEGLTKLYGCAILVTNAVVQSLLRPEMFNLRLVDNAVKVKGKEEAIAVYAVTEA